MTKLEELKAAAVAADTAAIAAWDVRNSAARAADAAWDATHAAADAAWAAYNDELEKTQKENSND